MALLYTAFDIAKELAAQLPDTDLGVTNTYTTDIDTTKNTVIRLDNGQEFLLTVTPWAGPQPEGR